MWGFKCIDEVNYRIDVIWIVSALSMMTMGDEASVKYEGKEKQLSDCRKLWKYMQMKFKNTVGHSMCEEEETWEGYAA